MGSPTVDHWVPADDRTVTFTDWCLDRRGLVLERRAVQQSRATEELIATSVDAPAAAPDDEVMGLPQAQTVSARDGGGSVRAVRVDSAPQTRFFEPSADPAGFTRLGRFSVVPPQGQPSQAGVNGTAIAETDDVWTAADGTFIVVAQGGRLDGAPALTPIADATGVELGPLGRGEELVSPVGSEVRVTLPTGRYVRIYGTVTVAMLVALAQSLQDTPGGQGVVFVS
jgi:hypothetical protein